MGHMTCMQAICVANETQTSVRQSVNSVINITSFGNKNKPPYIYNCHIINITSFLNLFMHR